jgi:predicted PurR-regulated permease PerM
LPPIVDWMRSVGGEGTEPSLGGIPPWLVTGGIAAWLGLGVVGLVVAFAGFISLTASITVPLVVAVVVGAIASPLAEWLVARRVPKPIAASIVLLGLILVIVLTFWVVIEGVISQAGQITAQVQDGLDRLSSALPALGVNATAIKNALSVNATESLTKTAGSGVLSSLASALSSGISAVFGLFFGIFIGFAMLYYVLSDFPTIKNWIGRHTGLPVALGEGVVQDGVDSLRGYFKGTTFTGLAVAAVIGAAVWALGVPLALPIALVTFLTCYIPFFGAIISGAFACLVALGASGLESAVIVLIVVLVAQNLLQTVLNAKFMGVSLSLSPLVILVVTMLGSILGGILGAVLAAPLTALAVRTAARLREARQRVGSPAGETLEAAPVGGSALQVE